MASEPIRTLGGLILPGELAVKRILKPVTYALAALYFLADAAFMAIAKPISDWLARHVVLRRLRAWFTFLRPYPSLALFSIPVIITRDKLMKIPAFAWAYTKFREAKTWLKNTEAWQAIRAISKAARQYLTEMKKSAAVAFRTS